MTTPGNPPPNPLAALEVVRTNPTSPDPAISPRLTPTEAMRYMRTRQLADLPLAEGAHPVLFQVQRLPAAFLADVLDSVFPLAARRQVAFRSAVHAIIQGGQVVLGPDSHALKVHDARVAPKGAAYVGTDGDHGVTLAPLSFVQAVADLYGAETVQEMGQVAIDHARLPRGAAGPFSSWGGSVASS